jgi:hydroxymethylbilane synthase
MVAAPSELRLGTRGSPLALWQAHAVAARIAAAGGPPSRVVIIKTSADRWPEEPLFRIGGKRLFVRELEEALGRGDIDLAVHSSKDLPSDLPDGLAIAGVLAREDPLDALVLSERAEGLRAQGSGGAQGTGAPCLTASLEELMATLGPSPVIGTGSVRRVAQLTRLMPGARFTPVRGNLDTRLRKLDSGEYDALVLAAAGLRRLGLASRISLRLPCTACVPAPGQGIVAVETRRDDETVNRFVARIDDREASAALEAERALVAALGGDCQTPIGALASPLDRHDLELVAIVVSTDGGRVVRGYGRGDGREAAAIGARVGAQMIGDGADEILAGARKGQVSSLKSRV